MVRLVTSPQKRRTSVLENREFVDQKAEAKIREVKRWIEAHRDQLSRQGAVVETFRNYRGRRLGPYYRLAYRDRDGRQRSLYLGASAELAEQVRGLLEEYQASLRVQRERRRVLEIFRAELKKAKALWGDELAKRGLRLQGYEVRGWRGSPNAETHETGQSSSQVVRDDPQESENPKGDQLKECRL